MPENMLIRHGEPSKYDHSPYGTICKSVRALSDEFEIYVQLSNDESVPSWEMVGIFTKGTEHAIQEEVQRLINR